jgi:hypothetical protein
LALEFEKKTMGVVKLFRHPLMRVWFVACIVGLSPAGEGGKAVAKTSVEHKYSNRLANESSPYLLQHAHNPVDWYPWGAEALERAKKDRLFDMSLVSRDGAREFYG